MLNENYILTSYDASQAMLQWSAVNDTDVSYVFVNGVNILGNFQFPTKDRVMLIPFKKSKCIVLEIHDFTVPEPNILPITEVSNKNPIVAWQAKEDAVKYKVYANNKLLHTVPKVENAESYEKQLIYPEFYGKIWTWHFFTVTSVDQYNNESLLKYFPYFIWDLPPIVKELEVTNGSGAGLYDFNITL